MLSTAQHIVKILTKDEVVKFVVGNIMLFNYPYLVMSYKVICYFK